MKTLLISIFLFLSLTAIAQTEDAQRQIDLMANEYISAKQNHGLIIGLVYKGQKKVFVYGETRKGNKQLPNEQSIFEIGELSGLFTTTLLARKCMEGDLSFDTPLSALMPPGQGLLVYQKLNCGPVWPNSSIYSCDPKSDDGVIPVLLCNLATHTAGLPLKPRNLRGWLHPKNPFARYKKEHLYYFLNSYPLSFAGDFDYNYSYVGMGLLGHALSSKDSTPFETLLESKVLQPLSFQNTAVHLNKVQQALFLDGHTKRGKLTPHWVFDVLAPSAGLRSNMDDMMNFLSANMGVNHPEWSYTFSLAHTPRNKIREKELLDSEAALGWLVSPIPGVQEEVIWQKGSTGGFSSYIGILKQSGVGVVILSNSANPVNQMGVQLLKTMYQQGVQIKNISGPVKR